MLLSVFFSIIWDYQISPYKTRHSGKCLGIFGFGLLVPFTVWVDNIQWFKEWQHLATCMDVLSKHQVLAINRSFEKYLPTCRNIHVCTECGVYGQVFKAWAFKGVREYASLIKFIFWIWEISFVPLAKLLQQKINLRYYVPYHCVHNYIKFQSYWQIIA